jgi:hypothetical protein
LAILFQTPTPTEREKANFMMALLGRHALELVGKPVATHATLVSFNEIIGILDFAFRNLEDEADAF